MKRGRKVNAWFPFYVDKWLLGSTRLELILQDENGFLDLRGIWVDLLTIAHKDDGWIRANERTPYPTRMLAGMLCVPEEMLLKTIEICLKAGKLEESDIPGIYYVPSIETYGFSRGHQYRVETDLSPNATHPSHNETHQSHKDTKQSPAATTSSNKKPPYPPPPPPPDLSDNTENHRIGFAPTFSQRPNSFELVDDNLSYVTKSSHNETKLSPDETKMSSYNIIYNKRVYNKKENKNTYTPPKKEKPDPIPYDLIIQDLNLKAGTNYRPTSKSTREMIRARWNEGFRLSDFQQVHSNKCSEWMNTDMQKFLRPETLYRPSHFESYLNQPPISKNRLQDKNRSAVDQWLKNKEHKP